jgi:hypothetical protein
MIIKYKYEFFFLGLGIFLAKLGLGIKMCVFGIVDELINVWQACNGKIQLVVESSTYYAD